jgi:hypothetical protein
MTTDHKLKRNRLVQGHDYHGWAWKEPTWDGESNVLFFWAEPYRPKRRNGRPTPDGKWVRVRFVEVRK